MIKRTVICIFDPMNNFEKEANEAVEHLEEMTNIDFEIKLISSAPPDLQERADLLLVDYGGIMHGAYDTARFNLKHVIMWAREHPGSLVVTWSLFTHELYSDELEDEFSELDNVTHMFQNRKFSETYDEAMEKIKLWMS